MQVDTYNFLLFVLAGFVAVWCFRKSARIKEKLGEFEYFGLSSFWGLVLLMGLLLLQGGDSVALERFQKLIDSPHVAGFFFSILGGMCGLLAGVAVRISPLLESRILTWWSDRKSTSKKSQNSDNTSIDEKET